MWAFSRASVFLSFVWWGSVQAGGFNNTNIEKFKLVSNLTAPSPSPASGESICVQSEHINQPEHIKQICYDHVQFNPLEIRKQGKWNEDPIVAALIKSLNGENLNVLSQYSEFTFRKLAFNPNHSFVAEIVFKYGPDFQTNYVFGQLSRNHGIVQAEVIGYAELEEKQVNRREAIKNFENILNPGRDLQSVNVQVRLEDASRAEVVAPLVLGWAQKSGLLGSTFAAITVD
jgi:hypothetical protein